jgi:tryptophan synthase alpha chain
MKLPAVQWIFVKLQRPPPEIRIFFPIFSALSMTATRRPRFPASTAHINPAAPPPSTTASNFLLIVSHDSLKFRAGSSWQIEPGVVVSSGLRRRALGDNLFHSDMPVTSAITTRISRRFAELKALGEMGVIAYITAGDPSLAASLKFVTALAEAGTDVIELGVPFSDPLADGPTIQRASERSLKAGATLLGVLDLVRGLRNSKSSAANVPIVLFSYYNPILQMGLEKFAAAASQAGADGVLATDLTPEEATDYRQILRANNLDTIFLGAPTSTDERLKQIAEISSGFLYLISRTGVTGAKDSLPDDLPALLRRARAVTQLPIAVGFGISQPGHVSVLGGLADAAVIGSSLVSEIENATLNDSSPAAVDRACQALVSRIRSLKHAAQSGLSKREVAS